MNELGAALVGFVLTLIFFGGAWFGDARAMDRVHATLETRCVEGEQYSKDLLACVVPRHGR
jgi:hypothetical protein